MPAGKSYSKSATSRPSSSKKTYSRPVYRSPYSTNTVTSPIPPTPARVTSPIPAGSPAAGKTVANPLMPPTAKQGPALVGRTGANAVKTGPVLTGPAKVAQNALPGQTLKNLGPGSDVMAQSARTAAALAAVARAAAMARAERTPEYGGRTAGFGGSSGGGMGGGIPSPVVAPPVVAPPAPTTAPPAVNPGTGIGEADNGGMYRGNPGVTYGQWFRRRNNRGPASGLSITPEMVRALARQRVVNRS